MILDVTLAPSLKLDPWETPFEALSLLFPVAVSFGAGLNSTALLTEWVARKYPPPHVISFADTGNERKETYEHLERFDLWLQQQGFPAIKRTKKGGREETLEQYSLRTKHLPSLAYGKKSCSLKFKVEPQERDINRWDVARAAWKAGGRVVKIIGYGFEEQKRISNAKLEDDKYFYRFPLDEWGMDRAACVRSIERAGLPIPGKSACFFCPSSTKPEIDALPLDLKKRAIWMETVAREAGNLKSTKGLGRKFSWTDYLQGKATPDPIKDSCMYCVDDSGEAA